MEDMAARENTDYLAAVEIIHADGTFILGVVPLALATLLSAPATSVRDDGCWLGDCCARRCGRSFGFVIRTHTGR
jgi:hypothetical protein